MEFHFSLGILKLFFLLFQNSDSQNFGNQFWNLKLSETIFEIDKANAFTFLSRKSFARVDKLWPNNAPALWKTGELVIDLELRYFG